ncbi:MAG: phosphoribosylamine--glycine ligase [Chloroflexus sp.]
MKILVLGNDGRTHALVWKLFASPGAEVLVAPGNGGACQIAPQVDLDPLQPEQVAQWAFSEGIDLIVPASSEPLWAGLVDEVVSMHIGVCGASQRSTRIEWSRCYTKELLLRYQLPTPPGRCFASLPMAEKYLAAQPLPVVLRGDHPESGEGVYHDRYAALEALRNLFVSRPVEGSSHGVVIEEYVAGPLVSFSAITDGHYLITLLPARLYNGMGPQPDSPSAPAIGAITGNSNYAHKLRAYLERHVMQPLIAAIAREQLPYWGVIGVDCIIGAHGPRIIGLRCSLRNMEAQAVLPRMLDDLVPYLEAAIARRLHLLPPLRWRDEASVALALVTQGYPHHYPINAAVDGVSAVDEGVLVFHDQTESPFILRYDPSRRDRLLSISSSGLYLTGGHVVTVVALGATLAGARGRAIINAERIRFPGRTYREDVGASEQA